VEFSFRTELAHSSVPARLRSLDQDKHNIIDTTYIETAIFSLFKIDVLNYIKTKAVLSKEFHIQPSEIDLMPAWEYEIFIQEINSLVKEENDRNKKEMDRAGYDKITDKNYMNKIANGKLPNMPNGTSFKMPKI
jgi:hypothetical protein